MSTKIYLHQVDSTSDYLRLHRDEHGDFSFVYADEQTSGHGRLGRTWLAHPKENLTFSFIIKDPKKLVLGARITLLVAAAVARVIESYGLRPEIKWPNDIYLHGQKAVGILLEGSLPEYVIVGVGINVNQHTFEGQYRTSPTSLALELGENVDLDAFREQVFDALEASFLEVEPSYQEALSYFKEHDYLCFKSVLLEGVGPYKVLGIDEDFKILLEDSNGNIIHNASGELTIIRD